MKCEIIRDLLPSFCDGLCSKDTEAEILSHTESCNDCKKLMEGYKSHIDGGKVGAESSPAKPFKKIKKKLFKSKLAVSCIALVLVIFLGIVGYLFYGQLAQEENRPSFETIIHSVRADKLMNKLVAGDIDYVMEHIELDDADTLIQFEYAQEIRSHCRDVLTEFYNSELKDREITIDKGYCGYGANFDENRMVPMADYTITTDWGNEFNFSAYECANGKMCLWVYGAEDISNRLGFALSPVRPWYTIEKDILNKYANELDTGYEGIVGFRLGGSRNIMAYTQRAQKLIKNGMYCERYDYSNFTFDTVNERYLIDVNVTLLEKSSGKRIAYSRTIVVDSFYQFTITDEFEPTIVDEGVSAENRANLEKLFSPAGW